jgi:hypothetical protein
MLNDPRQSDAPKRGQNIETVRIRMEAIDRSMPIRGQAALQGFLNCSMFSGP